MAEIAGLRPRLREVVERWAERRGIRFRPSPADEPPRAYALFARECGIPVSTFQQYFRKRRPSLPNAEHLVKIATAGGVSTDWLLRGDPAGRLAIVNTPVDQAAVLADMLRAAPHLNDLPLDLQQRYRERIGYVEQQLQRLVYDAALYLAQLRADADREHFDPEKFRRGWARGNNWQERHPKGGGS